MMRVRNKQSGQALMLLLILIVLTATTLFLQRATSNTQHLQSDATSLAALQTARTALIGYAIANQTRPYAFPCPDSDNDGSANVTPVTNLCVSLRGWLPFKTLGIDDIRDASGERIWYALSSNFNENIPGVITNATPTQITLDGTAAIAVVVAPGASINQTPRISNGFTANGNAAINVGKYLEGVNANIPATTFSSTAAGSINDKLLAIRISDIF
jgi:type II secretory pathway pseudopilin PulG